jgi:hypothetical protein
MRDDPVRSPVRILALVFASAFLLLAATGASAQDAKPAAAPAKPEAVKKKNSPRAKSVAPGPWIGLEPKAIEILKVSSSRLAAARTMTFTAAVGYEHLSRLGLPLLYATLSEVTLQRPDKLKVITPGDGPASEFYYDGKQMMAYSPAENLVAVAAAPPTIDAALQAAHESAAIFFPFSDLIAADPYGDIADKLRLAFYVGQSKVVGGTTTDIVAYELDHVFIQVWIGAEDKLPRMARAVYRDDPAKLRHVAEFSNWRLDVPVAADAFASSAAGNAKPIQFARPDPMLPVGAKPAAKRKPVKTP